MEPTNRRAKTALTVPPENKVKEILAEFHNDPSG
jgi:hypothetical protein